MLRIKQGWHWDDWRIGEKEPSITKGSVKIEADGQELEMIIRAIRENGEKKSKPEPELKDPIDPSEVHVWRGIYHPSFRVMGSKEPIDVYILTGIRGWYLNAFSLNPHLSKKFYIQGNSMMRISPRFVEKNVELLERVA